MTEELNEKEIEMFVSGLIGEIISASPEWYKLVPNTVDILTKKKFTSCDICFGYLLSACIDTSSITNMLCGITRNGASKETVDSFRVVAANLGNIMKMCLQEIEKCNANPHFHDE